MDFNGLMKIYNIFSVYKTREEVLDKMADLAKTFNEWRNVFFRAPSASPFEKTALLQMATFAKTFGHWLNVYQLSSETKLKDIALAQLTKLADKPEDADWTKDRDALKIPRWTKIFEISPSGGEAETLAMKRITELMFEKKCKDEKANSQDISKI
jgi:hypothetical protein